MQSALAALSESSGYGIRPTDVRGSTRRGAPQHTLPDHMLPGRPSRTSIAYNAEP